MEVYDGVKVCEIFGAFLAEKISKFCTKRNIGIQRDDGLSIFRNKSEIEKQKKLQR